MTLLEFEEVMNVITAQNPGLLQKEMTEYKKPVYHLGSTEISYSKTDEDTVFAQINRIPLEVARIIYKEYAKPLYGIKLLQKSYIEKPNLKYADLRMEHPYNTYKNTGLPPGPICSAGAKAIEAALNPADTDYIFFVADGTGKHAFSVTYEEHVENINRYIFKR